MSSAAAPSLIGEEFPAVTRQSICGKRCSHTPARNAGFRPARIAGVVVGRTDSSALT
jgi:hypothetical protein